MADENVSPLWEKLGGGGDFRFVTTSTILGQIIEKLGLTGKIMTVRKTFYNIPSNTNQLFDRLRFQPGLA